MRLDQHSSKIVLTVVTLALALIVGLMIPFASGNRSGAVLPGWTPPSPTTTAIPPTASTLPTTAAKLLSPTAVPSKTPQIGTPSPAPNSTVPATPMPLTATAVLTPTRTALLQVPVAQIVEGPLLLHAGPERSQPVLGTGDIGSTYTVTARTSDSAWLQVCCVKGNPAWLSSQFVAITGTIDSLPVKP